MFRLLSGLAVMSLSVGSTSRPACKPVVGNVHWPSEAAWDHLNASVSGRLLAPTPPGAVCHTRAPQYNNESCELLAAQWHNTSFHAINPVSADYNDLTCLPDNKQPCSSQGYPRFVVEAIDAHDVQQAISFAAETGVRLVVKGTGHDFLSRSSASDSLSIYTHGLRGIKFNASDHRAIAREAVGSVKIYAGERMRDIYAFASENNVTIVGGLDSNVGIGGWIAHGGHSPISAHYGMGADQVLEMEVVTADGALRTVDENHDPDLFWALRGGGGSNFAVMVSVTVKAYPPLPYTYVSYSFNTTSNSDTFWSLTAYWVSQLPRLSEAGLMGYHYPVPSVPNEGNTSAVGKLHGFWFAPKLSQHEVEALLAPVNDHIQSSQWGDPVSISHSSTSSEHISSRMAAGMAEDPAGFPARLGSRLLDGKALSKPLGELESALREAHGLSQGLQIFNVAAKGAREPVGGIPGGSNAVLPAWRSAYAHVVIPYAWRPGNKSLEQHMRQDLRQIRTPALVSLAPDTGAYISEADPTEELWQKTFYGEHYEKLVEIKKKWDPEGVFWYKNGVGSEMWEPVGPWGIENGVGQNVVQLCKADAR